VISLMGMSKRFASRPSSLLDVDDPYAAYCLDEAVLYIMCRIEESGLPRALEMMTEPDSNRQTVEQLKNTGGVEHIDLRRNNSRISGA